MMENQIKTLICDYLALARQVNSELRKSLGAESLLKSVNAGALPRRGRSQCFGGGEYFFHGIGCRLIAAELELDFDFGPEEVIPGADPWKLYNFAEDHKEAYPWLPTRETFRMEVEKMISNGILHYYPTEPAKHLVCITPS